MPESLGGVCHLSYFVIFFRAEWALMLFANFEYFNYQSFAKIDIKHFTSKEWSR